MAMAILTCNVFSKSLGRTSPMSVILPVPKADDRFDPKIDNPYDLEPFKTIYLLHGIFGNCTSWLAGTRVAHYAEKKGVAVVMPSGENSFYTDNDDGNRYGEYVGEELVKSTRTMFNLSHKREDTYIAGLSMGGYGALRNGMKYSGTFSKIGAFSSAIIQEDIPAATDEETLFFKKRDYYKRCFGDLDKFEGSDNDLYALADTNAKKSKFFISCGTEDFLLQKNRDFKEHMDKLGADMLYEEGPGGHEWDFWDRYIKKFIEWL